MVPRRQWLAHRCAAFGLQASQQQRGLELRTGDLKSVGRADEPRRLHTDRRMAVGGRDARAHRAQRRGDSLHGSQAERVIADQRSGEALTEVQEGRIAKANQGKEPLYMFAALQRQIGYPKVPRLKPKSDGPEIHPVIEQRLHRMEQRMKILEQETKVRDRCLRRADPIPLTAIA